MRRAGHRPDVNRISDAPPDLENQRGSGGALPRAAASALRHGSSPAHPLRGLR
jgi:hypothetical protein